MPESTKPSPRPWTWHEYEGRPGTAYIQAGEGRHLCDSQPDAELIVEAVNNYDRLKKIEAAARTLYDRLERASGGGPMQDDIEALGEALEIE